MALLGQNSVPGLAGSSSALEVLHGGIFNATGILTDDAFTQANPLVSTGDDETTQVDSAVNGILSGSVAFTRPDAGDNFVGGPAEPGGDIAKFIVPLGIFVNSSAGNAFENQPAAASGKGTYMSSQGTYGNQLYESQNIGDTVGTLAAEATLTYTPGLALVASRNGFLIAQSVLVGGTEEVLDGATTQVQVANSGTSTVIGIVKLGPDGVENRVVYDQRI